MSWGSRTPKYTRGLPVVSILEVLTALHDRTWLFVRHKAQHPCMVANMQLGHVALLIKQKSLHHAVRNPSAWYTFEARRSALGDPTLFEVKWVAVCGEVPGQVSANSRKALERECVEQARAHVRKIAPGAPCNVRVQFVETREVFERL